MRHAFIMALAFWAVGTCGMSLASAQDKPDKPDKQVAPKAEAAAEARVRVRATVVVLDPKDDMKDIISELRQAARERDARDDKARENGDRPRSGEARGHRDSSQSSSEHRDHERREARTPEREKAASEVHSERRRDAPGRARPRRGGSPDRSGHR